MPGSPRKDRNVLVLFQSVISESCYHFSLLTVLSKAPIARPPIIWPDLALCQEFPPRVAVKNNQLQLFNIPAAWSNGNKQVNQKHKGKSVRNKCPQRIWDIQNVPAIAVNMPKEDKGRLDRLPRLHTHRRVQDSVRLAECLGCASTSTQYS